MTAFAVWTRCHVSMTMVKRRMMISGIRSGQHRPAAATSCGNLATWRVAVEASCSTTRLVDCLVLLITIILQWPITIASDSLLSTAFSDAAAVMQVSVGVATTLAPAAGYHLHLIRRRTLGKVVLSNRVLVSNTAAYYVRKSSCACSWTAAKSTVSFDLSSICRARSTRSGSRLYS